MESENGECQAVPAEAQLRSHDDMRAKVERRGPSRGYASLMVWGALAISAYAGVYLFVFSGAGLDATTTGVYNFAATTLLLFPILVFSSLINGARERFSIRRKLSVRYSLAYGLILAGFITLGAFTVIGIAYQWWLNLVVPIALFIVMALDAIRILAVGGASPNDERWTTEPLSRHAQRNTVLIGVAAGILAATSTQKWFAILAVVTMLAFLAMMLGWSASWGLPRTGYEWGPRHWVAFGFTMTVLFVLAVLLARTTTVTTPIAVMVGLVIFTVMAGASFLPRSPRR